MTNRGLFKGFGTQPLKLDNKRIQTVADPVVAQDAATKQYADWTAGGVPAYAPYKSKNKYNSTFGVYNLKSSNTRILAQGMSMAMAGGMTRHAVFGDSVSAGCTSGVGVVTFDRLRAWPLSMRDTLAQMGVPANGTGWIRANDNTNIDARWTAFTGTWLTSSKVYATTSVVGSSTTLTVDRPGTMLDVLYYDAGTATFTISIDGAASGAGFATVTGAGVAVWKIKRMAGVVLNVGSTVKITCTVAGTGFLLGGAATWQPNAGIIVDNYAQSGSKVGSSATGADSWSDPTGGPYFVFGDASGRTRAIADASATAGQALLNSATAAFTDNDIGCPIDFLPDTSGILFTPGSYVLSRNSATQVVMSSNALITASAKVANINRDPSCVHIALGGNDVQNARSFQDIYNGVLSLRNRFTKSDIILHLENELSPTLFAAGPPSGEQILQSVMYQLADDLDLPLFDWRDRTGPYATAYANYIYGDYQAHETSAMYADLGSNLAFILGGGIATPQAWSAPVYPGDLANKAYVDLGNRYVTNFKYGVD